jgi:hypothetical protein
MNWQDFKQAGRVLVKAVIGRHAPDGAPAPALDQYLSTRVTAQAGNSDQARWAALQKSHPQTYDAMQKIHDLCPELQPSVRLTQVQGLDRCVEYALTLPEVGEPKHYPVRVAMQSSTGRIFQAGSAGGNLGGDAATAGLLYEFAGREGYTNIVGSLGLSGARHVLAAGPTVTALRPAPRPNLRSIPTTTPRH